VADDRLDALKPMDQTAQALGRLQGDVSAILRALDELGERLDRHFEDDRKLGERIGELEREQARFAGAEASAARRSAGLASFLGVLCGAAGGLFARFTWGH
jgi:hypothetical protein